MKFYHDQQTRRAKKGRKSANYYTIQIKNNLKIGKSNKSGLFGRKWYGVRFWYGVQHLILRAPFFVDDQSCTSPQSKIGPGPF